MLAASRDVGGTRIVLAWQHGMGHEPLVDVERHLPVSWPRDVRGKLRQDGIPSQNETDDVEARAVVDEAPEDASLVRQEGNPLVDVVFGFDRSVGGVEVDLPFGCRLLQDTLADCRRRLPVDGIEKHAESMACHTLLQTGDVALGGGSVPRHNLASRRSLRACLSIFPMGRRGSS